MSPDVTGPTGVEATVKDRSDAKIRARAAKGPQQVWVALRINRQNPAVRGDDTGGQQIIAGRSMKSGKPAQAASERYPGRADTWALSEHRSQAIASGGPHDLTTQHACIDAASARGWIDGHLFIPERSMTRPFEVPQPMGLWPPPRTATSSPCLRANSTACRTSSAWAHRTTNAGRLSVSGFQK